MKERLHIAVDGGGTKTIAILFKENGEILKGKRGHFGSNVMLLQNENPNAKEKVGEQIVSLFESLCSQEEWDKVRSVTFTIPGISVSKKLEEKLQEKTVRILSDDISAYTGALLDQKGVCVSAGTGGLIIAPSDETKSGFIHTGAWGWYDDAGGGYYVGMLALRTLFRDVERGEYCLLSKRMLASFGIEPKGYLRGKLSDHLYGENTLSRREIAQFSLMVKDCAYEGCEVSLAIYDDCAYRLAELADIAYRRAIGSGDCPVALVGGLKKAGEILIEPFKKHLSAFSERLVYTEPAFDNFIGSVVVVLKEIGVALDEERLQNIRISQNKVE